MMILLCYIIVMTIINKCMEHLLHKLMITW